MTTSALSPVGLFLQERFGAVVLEEASNPQGTLFVLLGPIPGEPRPDAIESAVSEFVPNHPQRISVIVYPKTVDRELGDSHVATTVVRTSGGLTVTATRDWLDFRWDGEAGGPAGGLKVADLTYVTGSTAFLATPAPPPPSSRVAPAYTPPRSYSTPSSSYSTPRSSYSTPSSSYYVPTTTCTSSSTSYGSNLDCYTDGRLTYRSSCTIDSNFNIRCSSNSY